MKARKFGIHLTVIAGVSALLCAVAPARAQVSIGIGLPNVSIGINLPVYPQLVAVPGYPVYYGPQLDANYFFYDGMYWVYQQDRWYASTWYNGPWGLVAPEVVPVYLLRVPVRYYRVPPPYFHGWGPDAPPHWGEHWGHEWEQHRKGWDHWNRSAAPRPAPLPAYQRQYTGARYPRVEQQQALQRQHYRYQPHDPAVRQSYQVQRQHGAPPPAARKPKGAPQHPQGGAAQGQKHQPERGAAPHPQPVPKSHGQGTGPPGRGAPPEAKGQHGPGEH